MGFLALPDVGISLCLHPTSSPVSWFGQLPGMPGDNPTAFLLGSVKKGKPGVKWDPGPKTDVPNTLLLY